MQQIYEISQINEYLKLRFEEDDFLSNLFLRGEISNYKVYPSGHHYFTLKDAQSSLRCVMFRGSAYQLRFQPKNGMKVIAGGRIGIFPRDGAYQLYCTSMMPDGAGDLHVAFEQLKEKLQAQGLFAQERKKPLPRYPHRIAIVTSSAGAALRDMLRILRKRYPLSEVALLAVRVQGEEAPAEIAAAIKYANRYEVADLIITGRGGGSMEDLWAFNDERVALAIAQSEIPVISAVGHEPDVTISDYVADLRAATPSNAAELAVPDHEELYQHLDGRLALLRTLVAKRLNGERQRVAAYAQSRSLKSPMNYINDRRLPLDYSCRRFLSAMEKTIDRNRERFAHLGAKLDAMSPLKVLSRGYNVARKEDGRVVTRAEDLQKGDILHLRFAQGKASVNVLDVEE